MYFTTLGQKLRKRVYPIAVEGGGLNFFKLKK